MKKLILSALVIIGLAGSSAHGAAAMIAGFGAKAWSFAQASAIPVTLTGMGYELGKMFSSNSKSTQDLSILNKNFSEHVLPIFTNPKLLKLAGIESDIQPSTWYEKAWKKIEFADVFTDVLMAKAQKIVFLTSVFSALVGLGKAYTQEPAEMIPAAPVVPTIQNQEPMVAQPTIKLQHHRKASGHRRSGVSVR